MSDRIGWRRLHPLRGGAPKLRGEGSREAGCHDRNFIIQNCSLQVVSSCGRHCSVLRGRLFNDHRSSTRGDHKHAIFLTHDLVIDINTDHGVCSQIHRPLR
ncbi:hypothetical protein SAMN05216387_101478 [Nitrosovibrio tenuis]|uniref:Uncharacterized protein n=1 Tax=Nitrosovibrio tenuis TaxID=1233 RepID=A0A1H7H5V9_9PROT|nr:hypothetical protein SAMN05216387_101478 [Nitrosovibrio tenuis]